jgi:quercetin dioxygenase-like cupin family protein
LKLSPYKDVRQAIVDDPGSKGVRIRVVISKDDGAGNFIMRVFEVEPGGYTPRHKHDWEHEVFVLAGKGTAVSEAGEHEIKKGDVIFIPPNEEHQFKNTGQDILEFICLIPMRD